MPPTGRNSPQGVDEKEDWLRSSGLRSRPWVYEELLFGSSDDRGQARELGAVVEELHTERAELGRLYGELDVHFARIATLERRLKELTPATERDEPPRVSSRTVPRTRAAPANESDSQTSLGDRSYSLARCEGFEVDSPTGPVGFVEGLRFVSRIDQPDLLEVRGGRFGRQHLLIPVEQVKEIRANEERVLVRSTPTLTGDLLSELVDRVRRALHFEQAAS
jgi:hypothetical protein